MKMKFFFTIIVVGILSSCASTYRSGTSKPAPEKHSTTYLELADYLRRVPGLQVTKHGGSYSVLVRGISSISGSNEPLYVIDRTQVGSYDQASALVDPNDIGRVEVLKDVASTSPYGMRGANGVIVIHTKK